MDSHERNGFQSPQVIKYSLCVSSASRRMRLLLAPIRAPLQPSLARALQVLGTMATMGLVWFVPAAVTEGIKEGWMNGLGGEERRGGQR